ncbi:MAG: hypothetical protein AAFP04_15695 [Myxococcota bacterium]
MKKRWAWLGWLWCSPWVVVFWALYVLPCWGLGWLRYRRWVATGVAEFEVIARDNWFARAWSGWSGFGGPGFILVKHQDPVLVAHEVRHVRQWFVLGPLFPIVYLMLLAGFGYQDHPLEHDARVTRHDPN